MTYDKAIEYSSKLHTVEKALAKMEEIGLNVTKHKNLLNEIKSELAKSLTENNNQFFSDNMNTDIINIAYSKAINKL